jgi:hypothetical protein
VPDADVIEETEEQTDTREGAVTDDDEQIDDAETFPRSYVERLRRESAGYRDRLRTAQARADELARQLFTARVAAIGKLADPTDLDYSADLLDNADALNVAVDELVTRKPHLKSRKPSGNVGQGVREQRIAPQDFSALLRG